MFSGSYVAIATPMRADGALDLDAWSRLLEFHVAAGTRGIVVGGTTGESPTLTDAELRELVGRARDQLRGRVQLLAGAGTSSTAGTVERAGWLGALGVDALLVVTPAYNKPTQDGLYLHYEAVAAASPVPVVLYNVPGRTAVDMLPQTVARLAQLPGASGNWPPPAGPDSTSCPATTLPPARRCSPGRAGSFRSRRTLRRGACPRSWRPRSPGGRARRRRSTPAWHCCTSGCSSRRTRFR
jgi:Dihydrodipicolinate synthetase family